jgi:hypothetical protein
MHAPRPLPGHAERLAWFGAASAAAIVAAYRGYVWVQVATGDLRGPDFFSFYAAGRLFLARGGQHLYEASLQQAFQDRVTAAWPGHYILLPYLHPPFYTLAIAPLAALTLHQAYFGMAALSTLLLASTVVVLARACSFGQAQAAVTAALIAAFLPVFVVLVQGQSDMWMLLPLSCALLAWVRGRPGWAGVFAGLAVVKPQLAILVPALFVVRRSWRAVLGYVGAAGGLVLVSLPFFGIQGWLGWLRVVGPWAIAGDRDFPITGQTVYSLRGLLEGMPGGRPAALGALALVALGVLALVALRQSQPALDMALVVAASLVLSPYQNLHDLALLVVPGVVIAGLGRGGALRSPRLGAIVCGVAYVAVELTTALGPHVAALAGLLVAGYLASERLRAVQAPAN